MTIFISEDFPGLSLNVSGPYNNAIQNNAKLTIDASNETKIEKDFEVQLGSELEIK